VRWWLWLLVLLFLAGGSVGGLLAHSHQHVWVYTVEPVDVRLSVTSTATVGPAARYRLFFGATLAASEAQTQDACNAFPGRPDPAALLGRVTSLPAGAGMHVLAGSTLATADTGPADTALAAAAQDLQDATDLLAADKAALAQMPTTPSPATAPSPATVPSTGSSPGASPTPEAPSRLSIDAQIGTDMDRVTRLRQTVTAAQDARVAAIVTAPVNGVVEQVTTAVGSLPTCRTPALVMRSDALTAHTDLPESVLPYIRTGQVVTVTVPAARQALRTTLTGLPVQADTPPAGPAGSTGILGVVSSPTSPPLTYPVDLSLSDPPGGLVPGMRATAAFTVERTGLAVPSRAVHYGPGGTATVLTCPAGPGACRHGSPRAVTVKVGLVGDTLTQITAGLAPGAVVVLPGPTTGTTQSP
jgi:hypothetical protein